MAAANDTSPANTTPDKSGRHHDEVALLSLRADGSPDQYDPELLGDKEATKEATRRQFREQAVSATPDVVTGATEAPSKTEDPAIEKARKAHEAAAKRSEKDADKAVEKLTDK